MEVILISLVVVSLQNYRNETRSISQTSVKLLKSNVVMYICPNSQTPTLSIFRRQCGAYFFDFVSYTLCITRGGIESSWGRTIIVPSSEKGKRERKRMRWIWK